MALSPTERLRAIALGLTLCVVSYGQKWDRVGMSEPDPRAGHAVLDVSANKGAFRWIQVRVEDGPVVVDRILVHFTDGKVFAKPIRHRMNAEWVSDPFTFPDRKAHGIASIEYWYAPGRWGKVRPKVYFVTRP